MSLRTRKHHARAGATTARRRARRATKQVTPLARSARLTAKRGVYGARVWAAPRVERTGNALQERVAPRVSAMLAATARRMDPAPPIRRRRWPKIVAGILMLVVGSAAAAILRGRRGPGLISQPETSGQPMKAPSGPPGGHQVADAETADVNGQVRTP